MRNMSYLLVVGMAAMLALGGCKKDDGGTPQDFSSDQEYIQYAVTSIDSVAEFSSSEAVIDDDGEKEFEYSEGFGKISEVEYPITPLRWGRRVLSVSKSISVEIQGDSIAIATINKTIAGNLIILAIKDSGGVQDTVRVTKPFSDTAVRKVMFRRVARLELRRLNWMPVAISLGEGGSPTSDFSIDSLQVVTPRDTFVITDPLNTWLRLGYRRMRDEIAHIRPSDSVQIRVTLTSQNADTELVALRWGVGLGDGRHYRKRLPLIQQTDVGGAHVRVFGRTFLGHQHEGRFNAVIDALSYGTLYNDTTAYSNKFWGMPYVMRRFF